MATPVIMPRQGISVETCIITEWYKQKGDKVEVGDVLFSYETDKASFEEEAKEAGTLLEIFFGEDDEVPVLTTVCVIGEPGEDAAQYAPEGSTAAAPANPVEETAPTPVETKTVASATASLTTPITTGDMKISPRARNLGTKHHVDVRYAVATGPEGRVIERDIRTLMANGPGVTAAAHADYVASGQQISGTGIGGRVSTADLQRPVSTPVASIAATPQQEAVAAFSDYTAQPLTNIRKRIAKAMHNSLTTTAQLTMNASFDATEVLAYRKQVKANQEQLGLENITLNDLVVFAVSRILPNYPALNAHLIDDTLNIYNNVHMGVAVDTERGLMVPTVFNANLKSLNDIAKDTKRVIAAAQAGSINPDELQGGTFTITNIGSLGIESFTPVLNTPQTGILGVCGVEYKIKLVDREPVPYPAMGLSLTIDHRAIDGAPGARFLHELKLGLENFTMLLSL